jgi:V/A-type H+/Na+-transporting ATPase subunit A
MGNNVKENKSRASGNVVKAFGNLLHVQYEGNIKQGEVAYIKIDDLLIAAEVIEIAGDEAKLQVFEDTRGVKLNTEVEFSGRLLEAQLGPGLLTSIFDGLQNPLEKVAKRAGLFLKRGVYEKPLDNTKKWDFDPIANEKESYIRGDVLGHVKEGRFLHKIMVPFSLMGRYELVWIAKKAEYTIEDTIAKLKDVNGKEIPVTMQQRWPVKRSLLQGKKLLPEKIMSTGLRILDTQFPVLKGGSFCSPGPFGAGKTVLQHHISKFSDVDIVIVTACGERAGEVVEVLREFPKIIDERTKEPLINRTVIICNTSSMPVAAREASVYMGVTIAEYYRQMGLNVLVLADSTSRWAQAMREMSGRLEEIPGEEAFPAYLSSRIAAFYERAGVLKLRDDSIGSLTIGGTVSPAGGNFEEPVTQATLSVVGAFLGLSRSRSDARRYPAIDPLISWTKYLPAVSKEYEGEIDEWSEKVQLAEKILKNSYEISKRMEVVGEEGTSLDDMALYLKGELYDICYLQQNAFDKEDRFCSLERQLQLFMLMQDIFETQYSFETHDDARDFFLELQNEIKNMNFMEFESPDYKQTISQIKEMSKNLKMV